MKIHNLVLLKKFKNTSSAQLCSMTNVHKGGPGCVCECVFMARTCDTHTHTNTHTHTHTFTHRENDVSSC